MTIDEILINAGPGETRIAFLSGGRLADLDIVRPGRGTVVGDIYLGRVEKTLPGIAAAFIDIGLDRSGFLGLAEARPPEAEVDGHERRAAERITDYVSEGDFVIVQIDRPPVADKGAKLTTHVSLTGHSLVYLPGGTGLRLSRRIEDAEERARLTRLLGDVAGEEGGGFILRTAAVGASAETLAREVGELRRAWEETLHARKEARRPGLLRAAIDLVLGALRDAGGPALRRVLVDDAETLARLRAYCEAVVPSLLDRLEACREPEPIFEAFAVEEQIEAALGPRVDLPSGGNLLIRETPMLVVIDVNSAGRSEGGPEETALCTDLEAAEEIARQLRLRELSGALVVDFIPLRRSANRARLVERLRAAVAADRVAVNVFGHTRLGLVEMTRPRLRAPLAERLAAPCPTCDGGGRMPSAYTTAMAALRAALRQGRGLRGARDGEIAAAPAVVEVLGGEAAEAVAEAESRLGRRLRLRPDPTLPPDRFAVAFDGGEGSG